MGRRTSYSFEKRRKELEKKKKKEAKLARKKEKKGEPVVDENGNVIEAAVEETEAPAPAPEPDRPPSIDDLWDRK